MIGGSLRHTRGFAQMVIEGEVHTRHVRHVGGDISFAHLHFAVLHVFRMHELDVVQNAELLEQHGTHEPVEITARHQPVFLGHLAPTATSGQTEGPCLKGPCYFSTRAMTSRAPERRYTFREYLELEASSDLRYEFFDGAKRGAAPWS